MPTDSGLITLSDGRKLSYEFSGFVGTHITPIVLFCNFLGMPYRIWDPVIRHLNENSVATLCFDFPGHGQSSTFKDGGRSIHFERLATDISELLGHVGFHTGMQFVKVLVGVGMGAATAVYFATQYPGTVEKILLMDIKPFSSWVCGHQTYMETAKALIEENDMEGLVDGFVEGLQPEILRQGSIEDVERIKRVMNTTTVEGFVTCSSALSAFDFDLRFKMATLAASVNEP